jgi:hypothetical protein
VVGAFRGVSGWSWVGSTRPSPAANDSQLGPSLGTGDHSKLLPQGHARPPRGSWETRPTLPQLGRSGGGVPAPELLVEQQGP